MASSAGVSKRSSYSPRRRPGCGIGTPLQETLRRAVQVAANALSMPPGAGTAGRGVLAKVAWVQAKLGETQAARETLGKAIQATKLQRWKSDALKTIVAVQTELRDPDAAKETLQSLRHATRNADEPPCGPRDVWSDLITATAWTGDYDGCIHIDDRGEPQPQGSGDSRGRPSGHCGHRLQPG